MVNEGLLNAIMERIIEQTKKKNPDKEIMKKPPKPESEKKPKRKKDAN